MKFCSAYYSDVGKKETNQDSLLLMQRRQPQGDEIVFAVICDGVGGLKMGEQASAEVVTAFHDWFNNQIEGLYQQEIPMTALFNDWDKLIQELHGLLKEHSENAGFRSGTTVEAVLLMKNQYYIQMPANFVALNENEMSCVEGGGIVSQICYAFGRMFRSTYYDNWESESKTLEQSHGAVVSKKNGVYTYSDGYTHTMSGGSNWGFTSLGDFFYGIGDLFAAFYL